MVVVGKVRDLRSKEALHRFTAVFEGLANMRICKYIMIAARIT